MTRIVIPKYLLNNVIHNLIMMEVGFEYNPTTCEIGVNTSVKMKLEMALKRATFKFNSMYH